MERWEYKSIILSLENLGNVLSQKWEWTASYSNGTKVVGFEECLNSWGRYGWELVSVLPEIGLIPPKEAQSRYRIVFKRRTE